MRVEIFPVLPNDKQILELAKDFAKRELAPEHQFDFDRIGRGWVTAICDKGGPQEINGLVVLNNSVDVPCLRVVGPCASQVYQRIFQRVGGHLSDQGLRGQQVTVFISGAEDESTMCPQWREAIGKYGLVPSHRFLFQVR